MRQQHPHAGVSAEQGSTIGLRGTWGSGLSIGMETSALLTELQKKFDFTSENVIAAAKRQIAMAS